MTLYEVLLAVALAAPGPLRGTAPWFDHELPEERIARLEAIAAGTADAVQSEEFGDWPWDEVSLGVAALAVSWSESGRWLRAVHDGTLKGDSGRSHCLGGIMRGPWVDGWRGLVGIEPEPTARCMRMVVRALVMNAGCGGRGQYATTRKVARVFEGYGRGRCSRGKTPRWATARASTWWTMLGTVPRDE